MRDKLKWILALATLPLAMVIFAQVRWHIFFDYIPFWAHVVFFAALPIGMILYVIVFDGFAYVVAYIGLAACCILVLAESNIHPSGCRSYETTESCQIRKDKAFLRRQNTELTTQVRDVEGFFYSHLDTVEHVASVVRVEESDHLKIATGLLDDGSPVAFYVPQECVGELIKGSMNVRKKMVRSFYERLPSPIAAYVLICDSP